MSLSKQARTERIVDMWFDCRSRGQMIDMIMKQLEVSKPHASTMYQTAKTRMIKNHKNKFLCDGYIDQCGFHRWKSNKRIVPHEILLKMGTDKIQLERNATQRTIEDRKSLEEYAERERNFWNDPNNEEAQMERRAEMRAAFGEGETVVNALTGETISL